MLALKGKGCTLVIASVWNALPPGVHMAHAFISIRALTQTCPLKEVFYDHTFHTTSPHCCTLIAFEFVFLCIIVYYTL